MSRLGRAGILLFVGVLTARLVLSGGFGWFVQQRMQIPLAIAAAILLVFGAYELFSWTREDQATAEGEDDHGHDQELHEGHDHRAGPAVGWLLALPLLVLISVAPTALGALAASRVDAYVPTETGRRFDPLPSGDVVPLRVIEFLDRAAWDPDRSLEGRTIMLEGLVVNDESVPTGFKLTRFMVSCCAADGIPLQVSVHDTGQPLEDDTWVEVELVWRAPDAPYQSQEGVWVIEADALSVNPVIGGIPKDPYESPY